MDKALSLPREIRDNIYSYIWDEATFQDQDHRDRLTKLPDKTRGPKGFIGLPHMEKIRHMESYSQFAREAVDWLYDHIDLCKHLKIHFKHIPAFFETDIFGVGVTSQMR